MALIGDLKDLALVDIIQINCVGRNVARLTVHYPIGDGVFYFAEGEVVDARLGDLIGIDAVYKALVYERGAFRIDSGVPAPTRTIFEPWANLVMEGLRRLDEERAGMLPEATSTSTISTPFTTTSTTRVQNVYQALIADLIKIKGIDGALVTTRDGTVNAYAQLGSPEKIGMMLALLIHLGRQMGLPGHLGQLQRMTFTCGQRKVTLFDQDSYLTLIEFNPTVRFEIISPHIDRAFRKLQTRLSGSPSSLLSSTGLVGNNTVLVK